MNTKSIRFRLAAWYAIAFVLATVVIFTSFYFVTSRTLSDQTDSAIRLHSDQVAQIITSQDIGMRGMLSKQALLQEFSHPGMVIVVVDATGQVISSTLVTNQNDGLFSELANNAYQSGKEVFQNQSLGGASFRLLTTPIKRQGKIIGATIVGHPIDVIQKSLNSLLITLGAVVFALVIPSALGGYILANRGLRPISEITERLKRIGSENLRERVPEPNTGDELAELASTFNSLLDRLGQAFERERQFIGDVAHELKTPIATLQSSVEVALSKDRSVNEYKKVLSETLLDTSRITDTIKNVLDLAWSESEVTEKGQVFNLSDLVDELRDIAKKLAFQKQVAIEGQTVPDILVRGKRDKMSRAILNLIDNAIKYTKSKGRISIGLSKDDSESVKLTTKDTGQGIRQSDLPHIFNRFYRGAKTDKTFGSGLGLAIAQAIVTSHHGKIEVKSKVGKGSEFTITLPISR